MEYRAVKKERTGWRDLGLSQRHRLWGWDVPAVDIDFPLLEYDKCKAKAIIEYKSMSAKEVSPYDASYLALADLGTRAELPVFECRYSCDFTRYNVTPLNAVAKKYLPQIKLMSEKQWVTFLYFLRGRELPESLFNEEGFLRSVQKTLGI